LKNVEIITLSIYHRWNTI